MELFLSQTKPLQEYLLPSVVQQYYNVMEQHRAGEELPPFPGGRIMSRLDLASVARLLRLLAARHPKQRLCFPSQTCPLLIGAGTRVLLRTAVAMDQKTSTLMCKVCIVAIVHTRVKCDLSCRYLSALGLKGTWIPDIFLTRWKAALRLIVQVARISLQLDPLNQD